MLRVTEAMDLQHRRKEVNGEEDGPGMKRKLVGAYLQRIEAEAGQVCPT